MGESENGKSDKWVAAESSRRSFGSLLQVFLFFPHQAEFC